VPFVTGFTLCQTCEGKTTIDPCGFISLQVIILSDLLVRFLRLNSRSPPTYLFSSVKETITDSFLINPFKGPSV